MLESQGITSLQFVRAFDWAQRCASENPGIRCTAEIGPWRLSYTVRDDWPTIKVYQIEEENDNL